MNNYIDTLNETIKSYYKILSEDKAEKFVHTMSILSRLYIREKTLFTMQMLADIMKKNVGQKFN